MDYKVQQTKLANNLGKLLRDNFGKGPQSINVIISIPYVLVYVRGFISPMEQVLLDQNQELTVKTTREFLMKTIDPEIRGQIQGITDMEVQHIYYDWNLEKQSGIFVGVCKNTSPDDLLSQYDYKAKDRIHEEIIHISEQAEKAPRFVSSYLISPRALIVFREGILVPIEQQLISLGFNETLRVAKRHLEGEMLQNNIHFPLILQSKVIDTFVDWDFDLDNSVITLILKPEE
ncbi:Na-translocating system protein MpsC family protein [Bacillus sp. MUM 13]|uniref:Na-translocating system protein MpsC family protein n=1 Tax=Bacillus sp. MUM 13 TaxID=1678001 RepID=UPI0008F5D85A|nr:Na-translocating system protein MpsC family protein [Bacillus sp. MUM 13]OIK09243.1 hypothetical protein BIV59_17450 [Bacillus sp. MUM 13]